MLVGFKLHGNDKLKLGQVFRSYICMREDLAFVCDKD